MDWPEGFEESKRKYEEAKAVKKQILKAEDEERTNGFVRGTGPGGRRPEERLTARQQRYFWGVDAAEMDEPEQLSAKDWVVLVLAVLAAAAVMAFGVVGWMGML